MRSVVLSLWSFPETKTKDERLETRDGQRL